MRFEMLVRFGLTIWLGSWACAACGQSVEEAAEWGAGEVYGAPHPRAALRVRAHIGGFVCPMQLDTGANAAVIWHDWNDRPRVTYCAAANNNSSQGTAGVIGLEPFFGRIVVFDFVSNLWLVGARPQ